MGGSTWVEQGELTELSRAAAKFERENEYMNKFTEQSAELAVSERKNKRLEENQQEMIADNDEKDGINKELRELLETLMQSQALTGGQESMAELKERVKGLDACNAALDEKKKIRAAEADKRSKAVKFNSAMEMVDDKSGLSDDSKTSYANAAKHPACPDAY